MTRRAPAALRSLGIAVEVYEPPGRDIGASCGQFDAAAYSPRLPKIRGLATPR